MSRRRVAYVTGNRADFGLFSEPLKRIEEAGDLELGLFVTGMHLLPEFGETVGEVVRGGFPIVARIPSIGSDDSGAEQASAIGRALLGLTEAVATWKPDVLIVLGDRGEMLAGAIAAVHQDTAVAHVHGGEVSGTVDGLVRHAITKLSHVHFAATDDARDRIVRLGERPGHVHVVGAPGIDYLRRFEPEPAAEIAADLEVDLDRPFALFTQHPVTGETIQAADQMETSLDALEATGMTVIASYPNADAGGRKMIEKLEAHRGRHWLKIVPSLTHRRYASLMKRATVMVGNSSSGLIEAPFFGLPVVNIGRRQSGRLRGINVVDVDHHSQEIEATIRRLATDGPLRTQIKESSSPYGDGRAGERIVKVLRTLKLDSELRSKPITY